MLFTTVVGLTVACGPELESDALPDSPDASTTADPSGADTDPIGAGFIGHYYSPWATTFMHFDDGSGWTSPPGLQMAEEGDGWFVYTHGAGDSVEFVFNDGELSQIAQAQEMPYQRTTCTRLGSLGSLAVGDIP